MKFLGCNAGGTGVGSGLRPKRFRVSGVTWNREIASAIMFVSPGMCCALNLILWQSMKVMILRRMVMINLHFEV